MSGSKMTAKQWLKKKMYDFVKVCPPARKLVRDLLFRYRGWIYRRASKGVTTDPNLMVFCVFSGRGYSDSPRALYEYMAVREAYHKYHYVWVFLQPERFRWLETRYPNTRVVAWASPAYQKAMAAAKYWVFNYRVSDHIWPRSDQVYLECWHGTPLKRLGYDLETNGNVMNTNREIRQKYDLDAAKFRYILSPSEFTTEKFISAWNLKAIGKETAIIEEGYPRNDFLLNHTQAEVEMVRKNLHITPEEIGERKVILYAPTWRDNQHDSSTGYSYTLGVDFRHLQQALGEQYVILFRAHYLVASQFDFAAYTGFVYDVSDWPDINELYIVSDLLITDYSSVFFDYANLKRPILFYMYDLAAYRDEIRGFYLNLDELPGPIVETEEKLIDTIPTVLSRPVYDETYQRFHARFNHLDDGHASERVLRRLLEGETADASEERK